jgi:hypothetical protein
MSRRLIVAGAIALVVALPVGCGSGSSKSAKDLYGTYRMSFDPSSENIPGGTWELKLAPGRFTVTSLSKHEVHTGTLEVSGDSLLLSNERPGCASDVGRYRWSIDGSVLTLKQKEYDFCSNGDRQVVLTVKQWKRH